jgi:hypothetical protein
MRPSAAGQTVASLRSIRESGRNVSRICSYTNQFLEKSSHANQFELVSGPFQRHRSHCGGNDGGVCPDHPASPIRWRVTLPRRAARRPALARGHAVAEAVRLPPCVEQSAQTNALAQAPGLSLRAVSHGRESRTVGGVGPCWNAGRFGRGGARRPGRGRLARRPLTRGGRPGSVSSQPRESGAFHRGNWHATRLIKKS